MMQIEQVHSRWLNVTIKKCETPRFLSKHVTSEQKVLLLWNKIPMEDKITAIS